MTGMALHLRVEDQAYKRKAALLSFLMHVALLLFMVVMVDWNVERVNPSVMEATLWENLAVEQAPKVPPKPPAPVPPPEPKPEPKPVPEPVKAPPPPSADKVQQEADIALKKQEAEKARKLEEEKKKQEQLKKIQETLRKQEEEEKLKKLQETLRQQELEAQQAAAASAEPDPSVLAYYIRKMQIKIRSNMIQSLCPATNPELLIEMRLTATGDISGMPKMVKGSGDTVCDDAVLRAILASKPFDLPNDDVAVRNKLLDLLKLKLKPRG